MSSAPSREDVFGTYLEGVSGLTLVDKILDILKEHPKIPIGQLASNLKSMPEEIVSAVLQAQRAGFVRLGTSDGETIVELIKTRAAVT